MIIIIIYVILIVNNNILILIYFKKMPKDVACRMATFFMAQGDEKRDGSTVLSAADLSARATRVQYDRCPARHIST